MPRKILVFLAITALLLTACKLDLQPNPDPGLEPNPDPDIGTNNETNDENLTVVWEASAPIRYSDVVLIEDYLVFFSHDNICCLDANTGDSLWNRQLASEGFELHQGYAADLYAAGDGAIAYALDGEEGTYLEHLDLSSGDVLWIQPLPISDDEVFFWVQGDLLLAQGFSGETAIYHIQDGSPVFPLQMTVNSFEDSIYAFPEMPTASPYSLTKYNLQGDKVWVADIDTQGETVAGVNVVRLIEGIVLHNAYSIDADMSKVIALDERDGKVLWSAAGMVGDWMTVDNQEVFCLRSGDKMTFLAARTGQVVAGIESAGIWLCSQDNTVYLSGDDSLVAIDVKTGTGQWELKVGWFHFELVESGTIWGVSQGETLYAIELDSGEILADIPGGDDDAPKFIQTLQPAGKRYLLVNMAAEAGGEMVALFDAATGAKLWEHSGQGQVHPQIITDTKGEASVILLDGLALTRMGLDGELWQYPLPQGQEYKGMLAGESHIVLSLSEAVVYLDLAKGHELYRFEVKGSLVSLIGDKAIVVGDRVWCIAPPKK